MTTPRVVGPDIAGDRGRPPPVPKYRGCLLGVAFDSVVMAAKSFCKLATAGAKQQGTAWSHRREMS
jgi:hypothetical protein